MIIGVGIDQFTRMYGMGIGVPRALGHPGMMAIPNVHFDVQIHHAATDFNVVNLVLLVPRCLTSKVSSPRK